MRPLFLALITVPLLLCGCSSTYEIPGGHASAPPALDGTHAGWQGKLFDLKDPQLYVGVQEDSGFVYLCLESPDREVAGAMSRMGVQVTFIPDGAEERKFGFRFPVASRRPPSEMEPEGSEMEFIGPGGDVILRAPSLTVERQYGFAVTLRPTGPSTLFQCKVPRVARTQHLGIGPLVTGNLEIAIEIPKGRTGSVRGPRGEGGMGGDMGGVPGEGSGGGMGGSGGRPGGGGGRRGGGPGEGGPSARPSGGTDTVILHVKMAPHE